MADTPRGTLEQRKLGERPGGYVGIRNFDAGIIETMGGKIVKDNYYLQLASLTPMSAPPGYSGIPIVFSHAEDLFERDTLAAVEVRRDDISPAMNRWHPGLKVWSSPADGAQEVEVRSGDPLNPTIRRGWDRREEQQQALPFDITYTISIKARHRGFGKGGETPTGSASPKTQVNKLLDYMLRIFPTYCTVVVKDSLGDLRSYHAFLEAISHLDDLAQVSERMLGFALTLRVAAELDVHDPVESMAVTMVRLRSSIA